MIVDSGSGLIVILRGLILSLLVLLTACGGGGGGGGGSDDDDDVSIEASTGQYSAREGGFSGFSGLLPENQTSLSSCRTVSPPAPQANLTGRVRFERVPLDYSGLDYDNRSYQPARGVVVEALSGSGGQCSDQVLARTLTDGNGEFGFQLGADQQVCLQVRAQMYRGSGDDRWDVQVTDNSAGNAPYYLLDPQVATPTEQAYRELLAGSGWDDGLRSYNEARAAAPFAILDSLCDAIAEVQAVHGDMELPTLYIRWSENNISVDGELADGEVGTPFFRQVQLINSSNVVVETINEIFLLGSQNSNTDEYDPHVIVHEAGHFIVANLGRSDSFGGQHRLSDRLDMTVAFDEGYASAFAGMVLDSVIANPQIYQDTLGSRQNSAYRFDMQRELSSNRGWYSETSVFKIIYDLFDSDNLSAEDDISMGFAPIHDAILQQRNVESLTSIFSFIEALKTSNPAAVNDINQLASDQGLNAGSLDQWASNETATGNSGISGASDVVPVYHNVILNTPATYCSNDQFGRVNKLSVIQYLRFDVPASGDYQFLVEPVSGSYGDGRSVLEFFRRGQYLRALEASAAGDSVNRTLSLSRGDYVLALYHFDNVFEDQGNDQGRRCFRVTVN